MNLSQSLKYTLLLLALTAPGTALSAADRSEQRLLFLETEKALARGDREAFERGLAGLSDYPLLPYLHFLELEKRLSSDHDEEVQQFMLQWPDSPLGQRLQHRWLRQVVQEGRWELLEAHAPDSLGTTMNCQYRSAMLGNGRQKQALEGVESLWLVGHSQPASCDQLFKAWREVGGPGTELAWQRFVLAMNAGQNGLAAYLRRYMDDAHGVWADRWLWLAQDPLRLAHIDWEPGRHEEGMLIIGHSLRQLARSNPREALNLWKPNRGTWIHDPQQALELDRFIALRLALRERGAALPHLASLPDAVFDDTLRQWQLRAALVAQDWSTVLVALDGMSAQVQQEANWVYWRARALEQLGHREQALNLYDQISEQRNFHGFLAADRTGRPYQMGHRPTQVDAKTLDTLDARKGLQRALELHVLGRHVDARREWQHLESQLEGQELLAAAILAQRAGWHHMAILAAARAREFDDIDLRFPLAHSDLVLEHARLQDINPAWAMAVIRQESAFMNDARSPAGALGLMQVMPDTGRNMGRQIGIPINRDTQLLDPRVNVHIGSAYLRRNLDRFGGQVLLSTAAYNAGAGRVMDWLPPEHAVPADIWVELIPFPETRDYVRRVLAYKIIYEIRLGLKPSRLQELLPPVPPADRIVQASLQRAGDRR